MSRLLHPELEVRLKYTSCCLKATLKWFPSKPYKWLPCCQKPWSRTWGLWATSHELAGRVSLRQPPNTLVGNVRLPESVPWLWPSKESQHQAEIRRSWDRRKPTLVLENRRTIAFSCCVANTKQEQKSPQRAPHTSRTLLRRLDEAECVKGVDHTPLGVHVLNIRHVCMCHDSKNLRVKVLLNGMAMFETTSRLTSG